MSLRDAASALYTQLSDLPQLQTVGMGNDILYVYLKSRVKDVPTQFRGYPVEVKVVGKIVPAGSQEPGV
jgi:hypothetical protein